MENVIWSPEIFLSKFGSTLLVKFRGGAEKVSLQGVQVAQKQWLQLKCQRLSKDIHLYTNQVFLDIFHFYLNDISLKELFFSYELFK